MSVTQILNIRCGLSNEQCKSRLGNQRLNQQEYRPTHEKKCNFLSPDIFPIAIHTAGKILRYLLSKYLSNIYIFFP